MEKFMRIALFTITVLITAIASAHKPGFYTIDNNPNAVVLFAVAKDCPKVPNAMTGRLRTFTFSDAAVAAPYSFKSGFYVEHHDANNNEVYVNTDSNCVPAGDIRLPAEGKKLGKFSIALNK
jgi:hypothetical protein